MRGEQMNPIPIRCPYCGSYDIEWLSDEEIRCLDCGKVFRNPNSLLSFPRRTEELNEDESSDQENGEPSLEELCRRLERNQKE